jgi:hypothetical protein
VVHAKVVDRVHDALDTQRVHFGALLFRQRAALCQPLHVRDKAVGDLSNAFGDERALGVDVDAVTAGVESSGQREQVARWWVVWKAQSKGNKSVAMVAVVWKAQGQGNKSVVMVAVVWKAQGKTNPTVRSAFFVMVC